MTSYTEHELIVPSLKIISKNKDGIDTKKLIDELRKLLKPNGEDILVLSNRADDKFSQKVRNLKSHRSLEKKGLATFNNNRYLITEDGEIYLNQRDDYLDFGKDEIIFNFVPLKYLNFDNKIIHFLKRENCKFIYDLHNLTNNGKDIKQLATYRSVGQKTLNHLRDFYSNYSKYIRKKKIEIKYNKLNFLYEKNKNMINDFVIQKIENNKFLYDKNEVKILVNNNVVDKDVYNVNLVLDLNFFDNFIKNNFYKNYTNYKLVFYKRILEDKTLDSIGKTLNVTRERIRQIEEKIKDKLIINLSIINSLKKIEKNIKKIIFESADDFHKKLVLKKIISKDLNIFAIKQLLKITKSKQYKNFSNVNKNIFLFESKSYETHLLANIKKYIQKNSRKNGIINFNLLYKDLTDKKFILSKKDLINIVDKRTINNGFLIRDNYLLTNANNTKRSNILIGAIHSTLSVTRKIDINELEKCIKKFRRINNYAPSADLLKEICRMLKYKIHDDFIFNDNYSENNTHLTGVRKKIFNMFLDHGRIMTPEKILKIYGQYDLNISSVNVYLYENLFTEHRQGIFSLAGTLIEDNELDRLENNRKIYLKEISDNSKWDFNNKLNIIFTCDKITLQKGLIYIPPSMSSDLPQGDYLIKIMNINNNEKIYAHCYSSQLWFDNKLNELIKKNTFKTFHIEFDHTIKEVKIEFIN